MARKTLLVCDACDNEISDGTGAQMRLLYSDARRGSKVADLCDSCASQTAGRPVARRGRKPKEI